jgi:hypothetical protein
MKLSLGVSGPGFMMSYATCCGRIRVALCFKMRDSLVRENVQVEID